MNVVKIIIGCISCLAPMILWVILGLYADMGAVYYIALAVLSIADVINTAAAAKDNIAYIRHHREEIQ